MVTLNTLMVASEAYPLAKTGGLGDAVTGMTCALREAGNDVDLLMPAYRGVLDGLRLAGAPQRLSGLPGGEALLYRGVCVSTGMSVLALRNDTLYDRQGLYADQHGNDHPDNGLRFAALAHAAVRICLGLPGHTRPDVLHAHDWHAGLVPLLVRAVGLRYVKTVFTVHNLAFQGLFPLEQAHDLGVPAEYCGPDGLEFWGRMNFLKAGVRYADRVTTVSRTYAREILTPQFGCGLDDLLRARATELVAVPNGIDDVLWNPATDSALGRWRFSADHLRNKRRCKSALRQAFGLPDDGDGALIVMGSRLTGQKMADVAAQALPRLLQRRPNVQVAILGQGEPALEQALRDLQAAHPGRCAVRIGYDETTAHRLHAGADILLHGSRFEPFGLTPLYAMRYGSVPVGSRVGGMADTIRDPADGSARPNGVLFEGDTPEAMTGALERAVDLYAQPARWSELQRNGMTADYSWRGPVRQYAELYRGLALLPAAVRVPPRVRQAPAILPQPAADLRPAPLHATA